MNQQAGEPRDLHEYLWQPEPQTQAEVLRQLVREVRDLREALLGQSDRSLSSRLATLEARVDRIEARLLQVIGVAGIVGALVLFFQSEIRAVLGRLVFGG